MNIPLNSQDPVTPAGYPHDNTTRSIITGAERDTGTRVRVREREREREREVIQMMILGERDC